MRSIGHQLIFWWVVAGMPFGLALLFYFVDDMRIQLFGVGFWLVLCFYQIFLTRLTRSHLDADHF